MLLLLTIFFPAYIGLMWKILHPYEYIQYPELICFAFQKKKKIYNKRKKLGSIWKFNYKYRKILSTTQRK